jgi:hypothetical protein
LVQATEGAHVEVAPILDHQTTEGMPRGKLLIPLIVNADSTSS